VILLWVFPSIQQRDRLDLLEELEDTQESLNRRRAKKGRKYNGQKKDRQYNGQKKDRQYNGQKKKDRQYNGQKNKQPSEKHHTEN